jgi:hypothetical protein
VSTPIRTADRGGRDLDRVIDIVARHLTAGEPPVALRARILARIDDRTARRRLRMFVPAAAGLAAIVVVAVFLWYPSHLSAPGAVAPSIARAELSPASSPRIDGAVPGASSVSTRAVARRANGQTRISPGELAWRARAIPALDRLDSLTLETIQPAALTIPLLELEPIVTAPLTTAATGDGSRR